MKMEYTRNNVFAPLSTYQGHSYVPADDCKRYKWVSLLPDEGTPLQPNYVYVCGIREAMRYNQEASDCLFVCIIDKYLSEDELEDPGLLKNIILIKENRSLSWVLNKIQSHFCELNEWENKLKDIVIGHGTYQDIFDISEQYLRNALFALDNTYRLIACSKTYRSTDPINIKLYEYGYHPPETLEKFYRFDRINPVIESKGPSLGKPGTISEFETICQWCFFESTPLVEIVEVFSCEPMSSDSVELFSMMMKYINLVFLREQRDSHEAASSYNKLLQDMVYNGLTNADEIAEAAERVHIPLLGCFDAYRIAFPDKSKVLLGRFLDDLRSYLPDSKIIVKDFDISILNIYTGPAPADLYRSILPLLQKHCAVCGISAPFSSLYDLNHACCQAATAVKYKERLLSAINKDAQSSNVFFYENAMICHLLECGSEQGVFRNNPYISKIEKLRRYDSEHNSQYSEILFWYLVLERKATDVGNLLHMHRNTVNYHLQHITDYIDVDLDDYFTRQGLLMSFHYVDVIRK